MMNSFSIFISIIPVLIMMYILSYNMPALTSKKQVLGVSIPQKYINKDEFSLLIKKYRELMTFGFIFITITTLIFIYLIDNEVFITLYCFLGISAFNTTVYVKLHNKTKEIKKSLLENDDSFDSNNSYEIIIDVDFIAERDKIIKKFKVIYMLPVIVVFLGALYALINYNKIPNTIPNHWDLFGVADGFVPKSYKNIISIVISQIVTIIIISFMGINSLKSRVSLDKEDIAESKVKAIIYLNKIGYSFLAIIISTIMILTNSFIAFVNGPNLNLSISILSMGIVILSTLYLIVIFRNSPNSKPTSSFSPDSDEDHWILGCIYNNPNDPSFMVEKKFGVGWTINFATPLGKVFYIIAILLILGLIISTIKSLFA